MNIENMQIDELNNLCKNLRKDIVDVVLKNGGHLASNLGVVELTVALDKVFNFKDNKILFDVGHQSYVYKLLTDRENKFTTLRKLNGVGPFLDPEESEYDNFISGHAGSALSAACGIAVSNPDKKVVVVIGDASIANGHSLEALNNMINLKNMVVVLNDNDMSIGESVGCLSKFFGKMILSKTYLTLRKDVKNITNKGNLRKKVHDTLGKAEHKIKNILLPGNIPENIGFKYFGVIDGHNIEQLISIFKEVKNMEGPIFVHVKTKKGKGYLPAEENKEKFHGVSPYNPAKDLNELTTSKILGQELTKYAKADEDIITISAGMVSGTGLKDFFSKYPDRSFDIGIAEGHGVTFAAGLAISGKKPYFAIYSTFLQRGIGQLIHDVSLQNLPIRLCVDRAGIVGQDGKTHHGLYDISFLLNIPNFIVLSPTTEKEMKEMIKFSLDVKQPIAIRYNKGLICNKRYDFKFQLGKWNEIIKGTDNLYIATGNMLEELLMVKDQLISKKLSGTIVSAGSIKPFDEEYIKKEFKKYKNIFVLEEGYIKNGFGTEIIDFLNDQNIKKQVHKIGINCGKIPHGERGQLLELCGLRGESLVENIEGKINESN
ncbi:1-deoxy-D-xylulose-5-phosphate synthase [Fusobacterium sp. MFO224]|uniref:1-deoxy-D-xylulose-5-phosphate synthase n=1 Tax=Fusobacterium sp. MFO224 TaxID=3378070 RepID=UPI00385298A4